MTKFNNKQIEFIKDGREARQSLINIKDTIADLTAHIHISSTAGMGKTHIINNALKEDGVKHLLITNNISMWAFGVSLATINYLKKRDEQVVILVDDCEELFRTVQNINIMKNVLDDINMVFHYQKHLNLINQLDETQQQAIRAHTTLGEMGFKVPTNKMKFVFLSNDPLPHQQDKNLSPMKKHLLPITDRVKDFSFFFPKDTHWGWLADVALSTELVSNDIPRSVVNECLIFIYDNWDRVKTHSLRTIKFMCDEYNKFPDQYKNIWKNDYLR